MNRVAVIVSLLSLCCVGAVIAQSSERYLVEVFEYASDEPEKATGPVTWLASQINRAAERAHDNHPELNVLAKLSVQEIKDPYPASIEERANFWRDSTAVLLFFNGEMYFAEKPPKIVSNAYLGEDKGVFRGPMITVRSEMTAKSNAIFNNLHCALTLYALAMDASRMHANGTVIEGYLEEVTRIVGSSPVPVVSPVEEIRNTLVKATTDELDMLKRQHRSP
jgi:hypothetical protein